MKNILTYISSALIGALIFFIGTLFAPHPAPVVSFGATNPGATPLFDTVLTQQLGTSDTTMYLKSVTDNQGNVLSGHQCFTVDVNSPTVEYLCGTISGTTVTGLTRNLSYQTATTTYATPTNIHRVGADVRITDFPALGILENQLNGKDTIGTLLQYANTVLIGSLTSSTTLATKYYVDQTAVSGAPNASPTVKGIVQFATGLQAASSTATGSTGALLALGNGIATDTPSVPQSVSGSHVIMSTTGGFLNQAWLDLTQAFTFSGVVTTSGGFVSSGTATSTGDTYGFTNIWGDGSDSASTTAASYTLTRDYYFTNYTVSSGNTINTGNYRIFVSGTLTVNGTIANNGNNGSNGGDQTAYNSPGSGGAGGTATPAGSVAANKAGVAGGTGGAGGTCVGVLAGGGGGGSGASGGIVAIYAKTIVIGATGAIKAVGGTGGNGGSGGNDGTNTCGTSGSGSAGNNGTAGTAATQSIGVAQTATAGAGGAGQTSGGAGGAAGAIGAFTSAKLLPRSVIPAVSLFDYVAAAVDNTGPSGGGGGGGGGSGWNSSTSKAGGNGGGGAGGNGGIIVLVYSSLTNSGSLTVTGGAGGSPGSGGGLAGSSGTTGSTGKTYEIKI